MVIVPLSLSCEYRRKLRRCCTVPARPYLQPRVRSAVLAVSFLHFLITACDAASFEILSFATMRPRGVIHRHERRWTRATSVA